ncbi:CBS domain-containing protein [uncultured Sphingomonas sp.]|uniref:CBS domain-containing protein n=1 Tax=uncultured Sphingomonas sp. TaxID=158754 RepID=UPI0035CC3FD0
MTIAAILKTKGAEVVTLSPAATLAGAVALLAEKRIGAAPVVEGDEVVGIFSERDVVYCLAAKGAAALALSVGEVMTAPARTVVPDEPVLGALSLMTQRRIRHLPVIEGGRLVGFVSIGDLVKHRIDRIEHEAAAMRSYIQSV